MSQATGQKIWTSEAALAELRRILPDLQVKHGVTKIGIFGSVARNEAKPESDLDVIVHASRQTFDDYLEMKEWLETIFESKVDLIYFRESMKPFFLAILARDAQYA